MSPTRGTGLMDVTSGPQGADVPIRWSLLGLTAVTGIVDAVSFLGLGHIFTANMTGNIVFLGFAIGGGHRSIGRPLADCRWAPSPAAACAEGALTRAI